MGLPGVVTTANTLNSLLSQIRTAIQNHDVNAVEAFGTPQNWTALQNALQDLSTLVQAFQGGGNLLLSAVGSSIIEALRSTIRWARANRARGRGVTT